LIKFVIFLAIFNFGFLGKVFPQEKIIVSFFSYEKEELLNHEMNFEICNVFNSCNFEFKISHSAYIRFKFSKNNEIIRLIIDEKGKYVFSNRESFLSTSCKSDEYNKYIRETVVYSGMKSSRVTKNLVYKRPFEVGELLLKMNC